MDILFFLYLTLLASIAVFGIYKVLQHDVPDWMKLTILVGIFFLFHALAYRGIL